MATDPTIDLEALYDDALEARRRTEEALASQEAKRHADQIRNARKVASRVVRERISLEIPEGAWEELEEEGGYGYGSAGALWIPLGTRDGLELRLAFRHRGITDGGDVLTVIAQADVEEVWVGSRFEISSLPDLPAVVDDAIAMAHAWDEAAAAEEAGDPLPTVDEPEGPAVKIEGPTIEAVLARAIVETIRSADLG